MIYKRDDKMKKTLIIICLLLAAAALSSCDADGNEIETYLVTQETQSAAEDETSSGETEYFTDEDGNVLVYNEEGESEYVTITAPTVEEMSPEKIDADMPYGVEFRLTEITKLRQIDPADSVYPGTDADAVYKKGNTQYFHYSNGELVAITVTDSITYACYYNADGVLKFCSDSTTSWYYDTDGALLHIVYTYYNAFTARYVYTFYTPEGQRRYTDVDGIIYDNAYNQLSSEEYDRFILEYADTQELVNAQ